MTSLLLALALTAAQKKPPSYDQAPVHVSCDDMVVKNRDQNARCEGHVKATRLTLTLTCDHSLAHYDGDGRIVDLTCNGNVKIVDQQRSAAGDKAVYVEADRVVTLTGHATVKKQDDVLTGEPILFYVDEDRVVAKGANLSGKTSDLPRSPPPPPAKKPDPAP